MTGVNLSLSPLPPGPWVDVRSGVPTPEFYRFVVSLLALAGGSAPATLIDLNLLFAAQPGPASLAPIESQIAAIKALLVSDKPTGSDVARELDKLAAMIVLLWRPAPPEQSVALQQLQALTMPPRPAGDGPSTVAVNAAMVAAALARPQGAAPAVLSVNTFSRTQTISASTATTLTDYLVMRPLDYTTGKPELYFRKLATATTWEIGLFDTTNNAGTINLNAAHVTLAGDLTIGSTTLIASSVTLSNGAAAQTATLNTSPVAGDPTKWIAINDNGTTLHIPAW